VRRPTDLTRTKSALGCGRPAPVLGRAATGGDCLMVPFYGGFSSVAGAWLALLPGSQPDPGVPRGHSVFIHCPGARCAVVLERGAAGVSRVPGWLPRADPRSARAGPAPVRQLVPPASPAAVRCPLTNRRSGRLGLPRWLPPEPRTSRCSVCLPLDPAAGAAEGTRRRLSGVPYWAPLRESSSNSQDLWIMIF
jgi:hypothetical protein